MELAAVLSSKHNGSLRHATCGVSAQPAHQHPARSPRTRHPAHGASPHHRAAPPSACSRAARFLPRPQHLPPLTLQVRSQRMDSVVGMLSPEARHER
jgi:hypothetical protein